MPLATERNGVVAIVAAIGERVDDASGRIGEDASGGRSDEHDPDDVGERAGRVARIAIGEHPRERRDERGRDEAGEEDEPDRRLAADSYAYTETATRNAQ